MTVHTRERVVERDRTEAVDGVASQHEIGELRERDEPDPEANRGRQLRAQGRRRDLLGRVRGVVGDVVVGEDARAPRAQAPTGERGGAA